MSSGCDHAGKQSDFEGEEVHGYLPSPSEVLVSEIEGADSPSTALSDSDDDAAPGLSAAAAS